MTKDKAVGVAVDFSKGSKLALKWAIDNLVLEKGDTLYLIHVKHSQASETKNLLWSTSGSPLIPWIEFREKEVTHKYEVNLDSDVLELLDAFSKQKPVSVAAKVYWGDPRDRLCEAAAEMKLDSLIMGSRGLGSIQRVLLGSVSNYVVMNAACPVTIVKDPSFH